MPRKSTTNQELPVIVGPEKNTPKTPRTRTVKTKAEPTIIRAEDLDAAIAAKIAESSQNATNSQAPTSDKGIILVGTVMLVIGLVLGYSGSRLLPSEAKPTVVAPQQQVAQPEAQIIGSKAPDFTLQDITGKSYTLSSYVGKKPVLLLIEATWCGFCKRELPDLQAFASANADTLQVITVANREDKAVVQAWVEKNKIAHPWLPDVEGLVGENLQFQGTPHHVLIDINGIIRHVRPGFATRADLDGMLKLLK